MPLSSKGACDEATAYGDLGRWRVPERVRRPVLAGRGVRHRGHGRGKDRRQMSVTVRRWTSCGAVFFELIVETDRGVTIRLPLTGVELEDLERQIAECLGQ